LLVRFKAIALAMLALIGKLLRPFTNLLLNVIVLPIYGLSYGIQRRLGNFYRPAKNRVMFLLSNRYTVHVIVVTITLTAVVVNVGLNQVRADSDTFGQQSILYSLVTKQQVEVIEEYGDFNEVPYYSAVNSYADSSLHAPFGGLSALDPIGASTGLSQTGTSLASPVASAGPTPVSAAPRTETITYTVADGDTLSTISQRFGISLNTLLWANGLTVRSIIKPGSSLEILPTTGVKHTVKSGDTLIAIAKKYGVGTEAVLAYNSISDSSALKVGQDLLIPGGQLIAPAPSSTSRTVAVRDIFTSAPVGSNGATKPAAGATMTWPTDLHYIVRGLSWNHTGVDIDCNGRRDGSSTNDNYSAMDGIVQFAGSKGGYGYAVEVDHGNGLVTRYGHFHSLYVKKGDAVTTGTPLGRCGSTGNSTGTHLHFEVIANGKFKNPANYLGY
jgi:murein DD-endopeptidase MepM/ murein hydrolase activator NlpD